MTDELFVGVSNPIEMGNLLIEAQKRLRIVNPAFSVGEVITYKIHDGIETRINDGLFGPNDYFQLRLSQLEDCVGLTQFETENVSGYTEIKEPFTVGISMGTYSPALCRIFAACVAASIAAHENSFVQDLNRYWSERDLSRDQDFMANVKRKHLRSK